MSKVISQKEAVLKAVLKFAKHSNNKLTLETRQQIYDQLEKDFIEGKISLRANEANMTKLAEPTLLRSYVVGLVHNWLRKDPVLKSKIKKAA